jgi:hypothetical protein
MFDFVEPLFNALPLVFELENLIGMVVGVTAGMIVGSLPGLTATLAIAVLIPLTFFPAAPGGAGNDGGNLQRRHVWWSGARYPVENSRHTTIHRHHL